MGITARTGRESPALSPAHTVADSHMKVYQAGMGTCWSHWAVLVSKPMRTAVQRWIRTELTAEVSDCSVGCSDDPEMQTV